MIKAVLFDLDGTLLPMDADEFIVAYYQYLNPLMEPHGYEPQLLTDTIERGIYAMAKNDGTATNETVFWRVFEAQYGEKSRDDRHLLDRFYRDEFGKIAAICHPTPYAKQAVERAKGNGRRVILATNPFFPAVATEQRIRWAGLAPSDFERYTTYEDTYHCKPNLDYYRDILNALDLTADECLMVGNDVGEDMIARDLGMQVFLLTDHLINRKNADISTYPHGTFPELLAFLDTL